jgi:hypothetical protein
MSKNFTWFGSGIAVQHHDYDIKVVNCYPDCLWLTAGQSSSTKSQLISKLANRPEFPTKCQAVGHELHRTLVEQSSHQF